jgi:hypothetical protein
VLVPSLAAACGPPGSTRSAEAPETIITQHVLLPRAEIEKESGAVISYGPIVTQPAAGLVLTEMTGEGLKVAQAVALLPTSEAADERLAETVRANSRSSERAPVQSPGPPGSYAFGMHLEYGPPTAQSPYVMVAGRQGRYVIRVEAQRMTHADAVALAGRLLRRLIDRAAKAPGGR